MTLYSLVHICGVFIVAGSVQLFADGGVSAV